MFLQRTSVFPCGFAQQHPHGPGTVLCQVGLLEGRHDAIAAAVRVLGRQAKLGAEPSFLCSKRRMSWFEARNETNSPIQSSSSRVQIQEHKFAICHHCTAVSGVSIDQLTCDLKVEQITSMSRGIQIATSICRCIDPLSLASWSIAGHTIFCLVCGVCVCDLGAPLYLF